jgi:hypothetical protein
MLPHPLPHMEANPLEPYGNVLTSFDTPLKDGHVLAKVLLSHCPFLATCDPANPPTTTSGEPEFGTAIDNLYPRPCSAAHAAANLNLVLQVHPSPTAHTVPALSTPSVPSDVRQSLTDGGRHACAA